MPRRVQDIVPNTHRSIRDIPVERNDVTAPIQPPKEKRTARKAQTSDVKMPAKDVTPREQVAIKKISAVKEVAVEESPVPSSRASSRGTKTKRSRVWLYVILGIIVLVAGSGYVASVYFSRATFTLVPKTVPISVNSTYISQSTPTKGNLMYELAAVKGSSTATVPAIDGQKTSSTAKGKVTLYNTFSAQSQRLIAGTRLSDDSGRIYRLASSVVVPGYTTTSTGTLTPGTVSASVTADQPGQSYNISRTDTVSDFKIVAYKGTTKYDSIYGRLSTDISGGFVGTQKTVVPAVLASTTAELQDKIIATLLTQVKGTIPEGYIMYPKAYVTSFGKPVISGSDAKSATVTLQGTLYGILFKKSELVTRIAGDQAVALFDSFAYETPGLESLDFSIANNKDFSAEKKNTLIIKLKGDALLVGSIPVDTIKQKLAGLSLAETETVLRSFKPVIEIDKSSGEITPPWSKVPSDTARITVEVLTK